MTYDKDFLLQLDKVKEKEIYAKVTALTFQESPITSIEGRITSGSINVDGNSAIRRTCSLTIVAQNFDYSNYSWGMNTKFQLEIGVKNNINSHYPEIVWFSQGIYIITSFNTSRSTTNYSISIQGKDKMCLLNGEVGGNIESSVDFGVEETINRQGMVIMKKIPIPTIIRNLLHHYAGEPYHNIIINDLDEYGLELLEYRYDDDLYLYRNINSPLYDNILLNGDKPCSVAGNPNITKLSDLGPNELEMLVDSLTGTPTPSPVIMEGNEYYVAKISYGQTAGYRQTDLTFAGDLIANIGDSITSVLDKIKNMLSDFEYFYNLDGQFVFQRKKSFINTLWTPIEEAVVHYDYPEFLELPEDTEKNPIPEKFICIVGGYLYTYAGDNKWIEGAYIGDEDTEQYVENLATSSIYSYMFSGAELITAFSNNPNMLNMRNDYSVWGTREAAGRNDPVHMRYAIDLKPTKYTTIDTTDTEAVALIDAYNRKYDTVMTSQNSETYTADDWDWRELIYRMAADYFKYAHLFDDFEVRVRKANKDLFPTGLTGYEQYYTDITSFWRQLYNPDLDTKIANKQTEKNNYDAIVTSLSAEIYSKTQAQTYVNNKTEISKLPRNMPLVEDMIHYQAELIIELEKNITDYQKLNAANNYLSQLQIYLGNLTSEYNKNNELSEAAQKSIDDYNEDKQNYYTDGKHKFWNINVYEHPEMLNFWFDFLDDGELANFNVKTVGARPKVVNDTSVKSIYFRETPDIIFISSMDEIDNNTAYRYIPVQDIENMFSISAQGKSAKDRLDELIYAHGYCVENVTITAVPIYYLQPNTRIHLFDEKAGLNGDYIVSKITIPLGYNGTMQITATKAAENII